MRDGLGLQLLAGGFAERLQRGVLNQVSAADAKRLELGSVDPSLDPLVHGLTGHRRVNELAGLFHAVIVAHLAVAGPVFPSRAAGAEARKSISEVHECQLYHSVPRRAIALLADSINKSVESQDRHKRGPIWVAAAAYAARRRPGRRLQCGGITCGLILSGLPPPLRKPRPSRREDAGLSRCISVQCETRLTH